MFNYRVKIENNVPNLTSDGISLKSGIISQKRNFNANAFIVRTPEARNFLLENWHSICFGDEYNNNINYSVKGGNDE